MTDRQGGQSQFDEHGLLTARQDRLGNATTFNYIDLDADDVPDALSEMVEPGGRTTTFAYLNGRLDTITDFAGRVTAMTYDAAGRLTTITRPDPDGSGSPKMQFTDEENGTRRGKWDGVFWGGSVFWSTGPAP